MNLKKQFSITILLFCTFLLFISCDDSQKENDKKIDELLNKAKVEMGKFQYPEALKYVKGAESLYSKSKDSKMLPFIYLEKADILAGSEFQKESFSYLDKIMQMDFSKKDKTFKARVYQIYAYNYMELGIGTQSVEYNKKAIAVLYDANTDKELEFLSRSYGELSYYHYSSQNTDSAFHYFNQWENVLKKQQEKKALFDITSLYNLKGFLFLEQKKQIDSALFYFQKGYDLKKKYNDPFLDREYIGLGYSYFNAGDFQKALSYFLKAEQNIKEQKIKINENNDINELLASTYEKIGNSEKHIFYLKKYKSFNDSLKTAQQHNLDSSVNTVIKVQTEETTSVKKNYTVLVSVLSGAVLVICIFLYFHLQKKKTEAFKTEELLQEKEEENQDLKQKVNESFEEVVQLAKDNSPEFLTRFQEVYPNFTTKLLSINPNLVASELRFCAMIFLNFSTKDNAEYTFTSPKTVQNRKNSIRKKLDIPSDVDLYIWFSKL